MKKRILIVDDHTAMRQMTARILLAEGAYDIVGEAENGHAALHQCASCNPEIVVLELLLPELSGREVLRRVRTQLSKVKVLVFSRTQDHCLVLETLRFHPHGFVEKRDSLGTFLEDSPGGCFGQILFFGIAFNVDGGSAGRSVV